VIDAGLVERLLNDCGSELDQLPVLQHCLMRLWDRAGAAPAAGRRHLTVQHYTEVHELAGALAEHANEILAGLEGLDRTVEQVFRALSETDKEGRITRRAIPYRQLCEETGEPEEDVPRVVDRFRADDCSFLVPSPSDAPTLADETRIDVGHEALLRRWEKVSAESAAGRTGWLRREEEDGQQYHLLRSMAERGILIQEKEFEAFEAWWRERTRTAAWAARYGGNFEQVQRLFELSRAACEEERGRREREIAEREQKRIDAATAAGREQAIIEAAAARERGVRRLFYIAAGVAAVVLLFLFAAMWQREEAIDQRSQAVAQRKEADKQRLIANEQRDIADRAMDASLKFVGNLLFLISSQTQDGSLPTAAATQLLNTAEDIFKSVPDTERTLATRVQLLNSFVDVHLELQDFRKARQYAEQARSNAEKLVATNPKDDEWKFLLFGAAYRIGDRLVFVDTRRSLQEYELADSIVRQLMESDPGNARWQEARAFVLLKIGDINLINGFFADALKWYRASLEIVSKLAASKPGINELLRHVANARMRIGDLFVRQKRWDEAYGEFQAGLKIREDLVREFPNSNIALSNLSVAYNRMALFLRESKKLDEALELFRKGFEIRSRLAKSDPNNNQWQSFLAFQYIYIADVMALKGDVAAALENYHSALPIREVLVGKDPNNVTWIRNLADLHEKVGKLLVSSASREGLAHFQAALKFRIELAKRFAESSARHRELYNVHIAMGDFLKSQQESAAARTHFEAALKVADEFLAGNPSDRAEWEVRRTRAQERVDSVKQLP